MPTPRPASTNTVPSHEIQFSHLGFTYSPRTTFSHTALEDISLQFKQLEIVGVTGPTGCGKSTLVQHINGLLQPTRG